MGVERVQLRHPYGVIRVGSRRLPTVEVVRDSESRCAPRVPVRTLTGTNAASHKDPSNERHTLHDHYTT